jgi:hypothetical protein
VDWEVEMGPAGSSICCELVRLICLSQKSSKFLTLAINSVSNLVFAIIEPVMLVIDNMHSSASKYYKTLKNITI